ncbi:MAG: hypothetical protein HC915_21460 [Anaerolineae bacterium]|nr:hypothetical protein [Anaerolineae bacterium]
MDTLEKLVNLSWHRLASNRLLRQLDVSYNRFYRHTLYRYWSQMDYSTWLARMAEQLPSKIGEGLTLLIVAVPFAALTLQVLFGATIFSTVSTLFGVGTFAAALLVSVAGMSVATVMSAQAIAAERQSGRWDLLMMLPRERSSILLMRLSSILYPYRPLIVTFDILQSIAALFSVGLVALFWEVDNQLISLCIVYTVPVWLLLSWERRQDYALSMLVGAMAALVSLQRRTLIPAMVGVLLLLAYRLMMTLLAFGVAGFAPHLVMLLPGIIGGPAVLPMVGVPFGWSLVFIGLYFASREGVLLVLWRATLHQMDAAD